MKLAQKHTDRAWALRCLALEIEALVDLNAEFLFTDREGRKVTKEVVMDRKKLVRDLVKRIHSRADRLEERARRILEMIR